MTDNDAEPRNAATLATSPVVTTVFEQILTAVHEGRLLPGERISDSDLAEQFGVSRTPVREALQRLREIGVIEASASRFTRIADVTPIQTAQAFTVWLALYRALVEEVVPRAGKDTLDQLDDDHAQFLASLPKMDPQLMATKNFDFFSRLPSISSNPVLQRALVSVVHIVRLGGVHLPRYIDVQSLGTAQALLIEAVRGNDVALARRAMDTLGGIEVPTD